MAGLPWRTILGTAGTGTRQGTDAKYTVAPSCLVSDCPNCDGENVGAMCTETV
jgi:hypothetical protein